MLSWPGWLTNSGHPSATGRAQDGERTLARDWRSTAEPRGPTYVCILFTDAFVFIITIIIMRIATSNGE